MRTASRAVSKQSDGDRGASTATGDSPLRPYSACSKSACSVLVGRPVDGPPRCTSMTSNGRSVITASPSASAFRGRAGPRLCGAAGPPAISATQCRADPADLVFRLEGDHVEVLVLGELV